MWNGIFLKVSVSEIRAKRISVNQGVGVLCQNEMKNVEEFFARVGYCIKEGADSLLPKLPHGISRYSRDDPLLK